MALVPAGALPEQIDRIDGSAQPPADVLGGAWLCDPSTGEPLQPRRATAPAEVERAIAASARAHRSGAWADLDVDARSEWLERIAVELDTAGDDVAVAESTGSGVPVAVTRMFAGSLAGAFRGAVAQLQAGGTRVELPGPVRPVELHRLPWGPAAILVPKVARRSDLAPYEARLAARPEVKLWAMIETAASIFAVESIAAAAADGALAAFVIGTNDLAKEAGFRFGADRLPLQGALGLVALAARAHGLVVLDGVYNALEDRDGLAAQCAQGVAFGFDGKTLIHPGQIEACHAAFTPDAVAVEAARRIIAAFAAPANAGKGALRVDGQMVERLHLVQARRTLAMAGVQ